MRAWMHTQLQGLVDSGYRLVAYGAAAKGMVLLHFLLRIPGRAWELQFVLDDAPLKQGRFCPGTTIPVRATAALRDFSRDHPGPLAIVVLAWNFWEEIANNIVRALAGLTSEVICVLPFPYPRVMRVDVQPKGTNMLPHELKHMQYSPTVLPNPLAKPRRPVMLISHFYNEEMLLPYWIQHHAPMFDYAVLIDYNSTDKSVDIIRRLAPAGWKIVTPPDANTFLAQGVDAEVVKREIEHPDYWHIALTVTEFLVHPDLRTSMARIDPKSGSSALVRFQAVAMLGNDSSPLMPFGSLPLQRSVYGGEFIEVYARFMHTGLPPGSYGYTIGRHGFTGGPQAKLLDTGFIMKFLWTPWPEQRTRKMQIAARIPASDRKRGRGFQHIRNADEKKLIAQRAHDLAAARLRDLKEANVPPSDPMGYLHQLFQNTF